MTLRRMLVELNVTEQRYRAGIDVRAGSPVTKATDRVGVPRQAGLYPADVIERWTRLPAGLINFGIGMGSYVIAALVLALVIAGIFAYRTAEFRRYVGVLWDLGTFWPRIICTGVDGSNTGGYWPLPDSAGGLEADTRRRSSVDLVRCL